MTNKIKESIPANGMKIIELYNKIDGEFLDCQPMFQRKLVWKKHHKYAFIETILLNFPFPEIYIASSEMDVKALRSKEIVVDGQQRLTAIVDYIKGINDFANQTRVPSFESLDPESKKDFLNYFVTVKDLKNMDFELIKEIFVRINRTDYSLNSNELLNSVYGDGEFSVFCKQIVDANFRPAPTETDIKLDPDRKSELCSFFTDNEVFSSNDKARMFDSNFIMLLASTIIEGEYFGRGEKIEHYLEEYNEEFSTYIECFNKIYDTVEAIKKLGFSKYSYWYNKANLFTLIVEMSKIDVSQLDFIKVESMLSELEQKVDAYFNNDETVELAEDEKRYFEFARHGSHEKAARIHRGKVIARIINDCLPSVATEEKPSINIEEKLRVLKLEGLNFALMYPTRTGLDKGIMDATSSIRDLLSSQDIHKYEAQEPGPLNKETKSAQYITEEGAVPLLVSLYKANGRGDSRIWFTELKSQASPGDVLAVIVHDGQLFIVNLSKIDTDIVLRTLKK